tara:strand:- start:2210 stop:2401 length:192 start_codon:yes stop_codon:yes gene_type:complete
MIFEDIEPGTTFYVFKGKIPLLKMFMLEHGYMCTCSTTNAVDLETGDQFWIADNRRIKLSLDN